MKETKVMIKIAEKKINFLTAAIKHTQNQDEVKFLKTALKFEKAHLESLKLKFHNF